MGASRGTYVFAFLRAFWGRGWGWGGEMWAEKGATRTRSTNGGHTTAATKSFQCPHVLGPHHPHWTAEWPIKIISGSCQSGGDTIRDLVPEKTRNVQVGEGGQHPGFEFEFRTWWRGRMLIEE